MAKTQLQDHSSWDNLFIQEERLCCPCRQVCRHPPFSISISITTVKGMGTIASIGMSPRCHGPSISSGMDFPMSGIRNQNRKRTDTGPEPGRLPGIRLAN